MDIMSTSAFRSNRKAMIAGAKEKTVTAVLWKRTHISTKRKQQDFARCRLKAHASFHGQRPRTEGVPGLTAVIGTVRGVVWREKRCGAYHITTLEQEQQRKPPLTCSTSCVSGSTGWCHVLLLFHRQWQEHSITKPLKPTKLKSACISACF